MAAVRVLFVPSPVYDYPLLPRREPPSPEVVARRAAYPGHRQRLSALAAAQAALDHEILVALQDFDRAQAWEGWGSCVGYLTHQLGWTRHEARQRLQTARALERLPMLEEALQKGEVGYSKLRKIAPVCDGGNEDQLLDMARKLPCHQLAQVVAPLERALIFGSEGENAEDPEGALRRRQAARRLTTRQLQGGLSRLTATLLDEELERVEKAMDALALERPDAQAGVAQAGGGVLATRSGALGPGGALAAGGAQAGGEALAAGDAGADRCALAVDAAHAERSAPASGDAQAGDARAGDAQAGDALARVDDVQQRPGETYGEARQRQRVDRFVGVFEASLHESRATATGPVFNRYDVLVHVTPADLERDCERAGAGGSRTQSGIRLSPDAARRLACAGGRSDVLVRELGLRGSDVLDVGRKSRGPSVALLRALWARDGGCAFPGCCAWRFVDAHHVEHWADGGETKLANLILLCRSHHAYLHEGGYSVRAEGGRFVFREPGGGVVDEPAPPLEPHPQIEREVAEAAARAVPGELAATADNLYEFDARWASLVVWDNTAFDESLERLRAHRERDRADGWRVRPPAGARGANAACGANAVRGASAVRGANAACGPAGVGPTASAGGVRAPPSS